MDDTRLTYRPGDATIWRDDELVADVRVERFGPQLVRAFNGFDALIAACEAVEDTPCYYDHHGSCQAHALQPKGECYVALARAALEKVKAQDE